MVKQIPTKISRGIPAGHPDDAGMHYNQTQTDWLNKHAEEEPVPVGKQHLHLMYRGGLLWKVVWRASPVCKIKGRCHLIEIRPRERLDEAGQPR